MVLGCGDSDILIEIDSRQVPISAGASGLVARSFPRDTRILVLGAGGWFGRTFISLLANAKCVTLLIGTSSRTIWVNSAPHKVVPWSEQTVLDFAPDVVVDFAYLTPRYVDTFGPVEYARANRELCEKMLWLSSQESVLRIITASSGAIYETKAPGRGSPPKSLYGQLKREFEEELSASSERDGTRVVIARAFSVSGGFVRFPREYALSAFVLQALEDRNIVVDSSSLVYRRYCAAEDLLAVAVGMSSAPGTVQFDSGGELVEMLDLARMVSDVSSQEVTVTAELNRGTSDSDDYHSDNLDWVEALRLTDHKPLELREQIVRLFEAFSP